MEKYVHRGSSPLIIGNGISTDKRFGEFKKSIDKKQTNMYVQNIGKPRILELKQLKYITIFETPSRTICPRSSDPFYIVSYYIK